MNITQGMTDESVLAELGLRLARQRLDQGLTQAQLAEQAGVSKRTVERLEGGASSQLANFIRVARALGLMDVLDALVPRAEPGPMALLRGKGKAPQRARRSGVREAAGAWSWRDDQ